MSKFPPLGEKLDEPTLVPIVVYGDETPDGNYIKYPCLLEFDGNNIVWADSPFDLKDTIKELGSRWLGFRDKNPRKVWSMRDGYRARFRLEYLTGGNPFERFETPIEDHGVPTHIMNKDGVECEIMPHQLLLARTALSYRQQIFAAEAGTGKTLAAILTMMFADAKSWHIVAPKQVIPALKEEFETWCFDPEAMGIDVQFFTYETYAKISETLDTPDGLICDESTKIKNIQSGMSDAIFKMANRMRAKLGEANPYIILMSGTPSPQKPIDIWAQAEICCPGFIREGNVKALTRTLAVLEKKDIPTGGHAEDIITWLDDENKCAKCGEFEDHDRHDILRDPEGYHKFQPSRNEVAALHTRLTGLMSVVFKAEVMDLPQKHVEVVEFEPAKKLVRAAKTIVDTAPNTMTGLSHLRTLSDGFIYRDVPGAPKPCPACSGSGEIQEFYDPADPDGKFTSDLWLAPDVRAKLQKRTVSCYNCSGSGQIASKKREMASVPCPKDDFVLQKLEEEAEAGINRIAIFCGFQGTVDRMVDLCLGQGWDVFKCDGRGARIIKTDGTGVTDVEPLKYWSDMTNEKVAFVANIESGGMGLTLIEARTAIFVSISTKSLYLTQATERLYRKGQTRETYMYILCHLPSDKRFYEMVSENRKVEKMLLGDVVGDSLD